ncbi:phytoene desaturase family protein [Nocardia sp. NPDC049190]|uniref:phytoene desaturase family protein n=1 Tax=Nocardia sp. NPDC049190 TaxID=3155650 RepID=UPI0033C867E4
MYSPRTVTPSTDIVVIGAGLAGLSTALHLAGAGRAVVVVEQASGPGGKAGVFTRDGYTFDNGPTVLTMPDLIRETFAAVDEDMDDRLELLGVHPAYRAHFHDGSALDVLTDTDEMAEEIARICGAREADGYRRFTAFLQRLYDAEFDHFINRNIDSPFDLPLPHLARLVALGAFRGMESKVRQYLRDPRTIRVFSFQALYAGVAPHRARALYSVISYMDTVGGVFLPRGGMHALPQALAAAARDHGVTFRYNTTVERVEMTSHGRARAVITTAGDRIPADAVVVTADPALAFPQLLGRASRRLNRMKFSPSCYLLLAGAARDEATTVPRIAHHNIHFGNSWRRCFDEIIDRGALMSDPSFLVSVPTVTDPTLAPPGHDSYYVLFPTPNLAHGRHDWNSEAPRYREHVLKTLDERGFSNLAQQPQAEHVLTPRDWQARGCPVGTPFSAAHTFRQTGPFRTRNILGDNIVLAGAGTHPGVGVPTALISGRLAAERITGPSAPVARIAPGRHR